MTHQPSEKRGMHRKVNIIALKDLEAKCLDLSVQISLHVADRALRLLPSDRGRTKGESTDFTGHRSCNGVEGGLGVTLQHANSSNGFKHKASQLSLRARCARPGGDHNRQCHARKSIDNIQKCDLVGTRLVAKKAKAHLQHRFKRQVCQLMLMPLRQSWLARLFKSSGATRNVIRSFRLTLNKLQLCLLKTSRADKRCADQSCAVLAPNVCMLKWRCSAQRKSHDRFQAALQSESLPVQKVCF